MKIDSEPSGALLTQEETWLLGQAPLRKYLNFIGDLGVASMLPTRQELIREWNAAEAYFDELKEREPNIANDLQCLDPDPALAPHIERIMANPNFTNTFNTLPTRIAMVEIPRLLVCQNHVTRSFVEELKARLGPNPDPLTLLRFCLPIDEPQAPVRIRAMGSRRFVFTSSSTDFRYHEPVLLKPGQISGYNSFGDIAGVVGLVIGYSCNFLNALCDDDSGRLMLQNGYHRANALLELGITHAPCVVQTVGSRDELDVVAKEVVSNSPGYYFNSPRPPMLKDFVDPRIRRVVPIKKVSRMIEVNFEVRDYCVED